MKVLVVDDDTVLTQLISNRLKEENYAIEVAPNGEYAIDLLEATPCSLVILDIVLPRISGIEVCQTLRRRGDQTPILMLTGKDHTQDKVMGLDAGADDYLVKPFELNELTARVRALLRRSTHKASAVLSYGDLQFDPSNQTLMYQGIFVNLRPKELAILELLLRYPTRIFSPDALLDQLWNLAECPSKATIKTHIRSLRKQLDSIGANNLIETLYGRGYRLNPSFLKASAGTEKAERPKRQEGSDRRKNRSDRRHDGSDRRTSPVSTAKRKQTAHKQAALEPIDQTVIEQTWQQVQAMSLQRLVRLQALVRSLYSQPTTPTATVATDVAQPKINRQQSNPHSPSQQASFSWKETCQQAMTIAHQLKGNLGCFGLYAASVQAQKIEKQLQKVETNGPLAHRPTIAMLVSDVERLEQLLQIHIDDHLVNSYLPEKSLHQKSLHQKSLHQNLAASLLIVSRDHSWNTQLQDQQQTEEEHDFTLNLCTPDNASTQLLHHTPTAILLEISNQYQPLDLGLLEVLMSNYKKQVPLLALIDEQNYTQASQQALKKGANATISKGWAISTVLAIAAEYLS